MADAVKQEIIAACNSTNLPMTAFSKIKVDQLRDFARTLNPDIDIGRKKEELIEVVCEGLGVRASRLDPPIGSMMVEEDTPGGGYRSFKECCHALLYEGEDIVSSMLTFIETYNTSPEGVAFIYGGTAWNSGLTGASKPYDGSASHLGGEGTVIDPLITLLRESDSESLLGGIDSDKEQANIMKVCGKGNMDIFIRGLTMPTVQHLIKVLCDLTNSVKERMNVLSLDKENPVWSTLFTHGTGGGLRGVIHKYKPTICIQDSSTYKGEHLNEYMTHSPDEIAKYIVDSLDETEEPVGNKKKSTVIPGFKTISTHGFSISIKLEAQPGTSGALSTDEFGDSTQLFYIELDGTLAHTHVNSEMVRNVFMDDKLFLNLNGLYQVSKPLEHSRDELKGKFPVDSFRENIALHILFTRHCLTVATSLGIPEGRETHLVPFTGAFPTDTDLKDPFLEFIIELNFHTGEGGGGASGDTFASRAFGMHEDTHLNNLLKVYSNQSKDEIDAALLECHIFKVKSHDGSEELVDISVRNICEHFIMNIQADLKKYEAVQTVKHGGLQETYGLAIGGGGGMGSYFPNISADIDCKVCAPLDHEYGVFMAGGYYNEVLTQILHPGDSELGTFSGDFGKYNIEVKYSMDPHITSIDPNVRNKLFRMRFIKGDTDFPLNIVTMDFRFKGVYTIKHNIATIYHKRLNHEVPALDLAYPFDLNPYTDKQYVKNETYISRFVENVTEFPGEAPPIQSLLFLLKDILISINPSSAQYAGRCSSHKNQKDTHRFLQMYGVYLRILKEFSLSQATVLEHFKGFIHLFTMTAMACLIVVHPYAEARTKVAELIPKAMDIVDEFSESDIPPLIDITTAFTAYLEENYSMILKFEQTVGKGMLYKPYLDTYAEKTKVHTTLSHNSMLDGHDIHTDISRTCLQLFLGIGESIDDDELSKPVVYDTTHLKPITTTFNKETFSIDLRENNLYKPNGLTVHRPDTPHANQIMSRFYVLACNLISELCSKLPPHSSNTEIQSFAISRLVVYLLYLFENKRKRQVCFPYAIQSKIVNIAIKNASASPTSHPQKGKTLVSSNKGKTLAQSHARASKHRTARRKVSKHRTARRKVSKHRTARRKPSIVRKAHRKIRNTFRRTKRRVRKLVGSLKSRI